MKPRQSPEWVFLSRLTVRRKATKRHSRTRELFVRLLFLLQNNKKANMICFQFAGVRKLDLFLIRHFLWQIIISILFR